MGFVIDEGLDAEADAVDAGVGKSSEGGIGELAGGALHGDLGVGLHGELIANSGEEAVDEIRFEQAGGAPAEINGVDAQRQVNGERIGPFAGVLHLIDEALNVPGVFTSRKHA